MFDSQTYLRCECCGAFINESEAEAHENSCSPQGIREDRAYTHVEESTNNRSFLCNEDGLDIAILDRVRPDWVTYTDHKSACLSDKGWQATVNLVNAAPAMLDALRLALTCLDAAADGRLEDVKDEIGGTANIVDEVITKATK